jgi:hypothetical protein
MKKAQAEINFNGRKNLGGSMSKMEILNDVDIKVLKPYPKNPYDHTINLNEIANSIQHFGYNKVSIGIDEDNVLLYGHGTLLALKYLGWKTVPMVGRITGLTDDQKKCYRVADNTTSTNSKIISKLLREELSHQVTFDFANYGMPLEYLFDMTSVSTTRELEKTAEDFKESNPDFVKPEKMWMYVEFNTKEDWDFAVTQLGKNRSRRVLDTDKIISLLSGGLYEKNI